MLPLPHYRGTTVGVLGLGPEGVSTVAALSASGATVIAWDGAEAARNGVSAKVLPPADWPVETLSAVVLGDGRRGGGSLALVDRATAQNVPVLSDLDLFGRALGDLPENDRPLVVAVTGAAGKSVTCCLIEQMLRDSGRDVYLGGGEGQPLMALPQPSRSRAYILELPIRRLATTRNLHTDVSVVLNVASGGDPDQVEMALRSILRIFRAQGANDTAVIGVDDAMGQKIGTLLRSGQLASGSMGTVVPVSGETSLSQGVFVLDGTAYAVKNGKTQTLGEFSNAPGMVAPHFTPDAAAAIAAGLAVGLSGPQIIKSLHNYRGMAGRFEYLGNNDRVIFVDDTFATCPIAARRSVKTSLDVFWIGGDGLGRADLRAMAGAVMKGAYLVGDGKVPPGTITGLDGVQTPVRRYNSLAAATAAACADAQLLAERDEDASPMVICAPGVPAGDGRFDPGVFRAAVMKGPLKADEVRHAS